MLELEGTAALEQLTLLQDDVEQLQHINELERSDEEELRQRERRQEVWNQEQLNDLESTFTQRSFNFGIRSRRTYSTNKANGEIPGTKTTTER